MYVYIYIYICTMYFHIYDICVIMCVYVCVTYITHVGCPEATHQTGSIPCFHHILPSPRDALSLESTL